MNFGLCSVMNFSFEAQSENSSRVRKGKFHSNTPKPQNPMRSLCIYFEVYIDVLYACCLYRKPTIWSPGSHAVTRCLGHQKRAPCGHVRMPSAPEITEGRPPTSRILRGGVPGARPTVHGHATVPHPGRSRLPGHMVVVGANSRQLGRVTVAPSPFLSICPCSGHYVAFFGSMRPYSDAVGARDR